MSKEFSLNGPVPYKHEKLGEVVEFVRTRLPEAYYFCIIIDGEVCEAFEAAQRERIVDELDRLLGHHELVLHQEFAQASARDN